MRCEETKGGRRRRKKNIKFKLKRKKKKKKLFSHVFFAKDRLCRRMYVEMPLRSAYLRGMLRDVNLVRVLLWRHGRGGPLGFWDGTFTFNVER